MIGGWEEILRRKWEKKEIRKEREVRQEGKMEG